MDCREVKIGKDDMMLMGGNVYGDWKIEFFHSMACYDLTNEQLWEGMGSL